VGKGAPIRIISPEATGAPDIFWFAKMGGSVASMTAETARTILAALPDRRQLALRDFDRRNCR